ncbi:hypothetical protein BJX70DRAFT_398238 [Aspergillus crustosus]
MENDNEDAMAAGNPLSDLDLGGADYDPSDEVLLLQIMDTANEAVSPNLQAMLNDRVDFAWPSAQRPLSPLLIEHPKSSGIDTAGFSFARPAQNRKPFLLQPASRRPSSNTLPANSGEQEHTATKSLSAFITGQNEKTMGTAVPLSESAEPTTSPPSGRPSSTSTKQRRTRDEQSLVDIASGHEARLETRENVIVDQDTQPEKESESNLQLLSPDVSMQGSFVLPQTTKLDHVPGPPGSHEQDPDKVPPSDQSNMAQNAPLESQALDQQWKVVKRRHSDRRKMTKRGSRGPPSHTSLQVPEEVLFQQLIGRLRAREESEAVASHLQKEMQTNMLTLKEENKALKEELDILGSKLRQRTNEARTYRSQTNSWKSKLAKVKVYLNDLGTDYQNLRGEAIHLKANRKSLDKERKEIAENIKDVKARMVEISLTSRDRRGCLSESEGLIASLGGELKFARKREQYCQNQLADEKKRSHLLELYIQNCSRSQDRKLDLVKANQLEIAKKIESAFETTSKSWELSHTNRNDALDQKWEGLLTCLRSTTESLSIDKLDVQQCREIIGTFETRMDATTRQLGDAIESHNILTEKLITSMEEQVQSIKDSVSDRSTLSKQLSTSEDQCNQLQAKLESAVPEFEELKLSINGLRDTGVDLGQQMKRLEARLVEVQLPERIEDNYVHISEKLRLETEIQQLNFGLKSTEVKLEAQKLDGIQKHDELCEMTDRVHQAELKTAKFEAHIASLQEKLVESKKNTLEGINRAAASSRQQCTAEFEQRIHELLMGKFEIETGMQRVKEQLVEAQYRLTEAESSTRSQRSDLETLLAERQKRIHDLEASEAEHASSLAKQEADIQRLREQESVLTAQQNCLQRELNESHKQPDSISEVMLKAIAENQLSLKELQINFSTLQGNLAKKEEDCQALHDSLSFLQEKFVNKEVECQSLQDRLAVAQAEVVRNENERQALQSNISSLAYEVSALEDTRQALQDDISSLQSDVREKDDNYHALQDIYSSLQSEFAMKEECCQSLQQSLSFNISELAKREEEALAYDKQLEDANDTRRNLESGKSKAQAQILPLLKRVQDSESAMKRVREVLHSLGIAQLERSWPDALDRLEITLQAVKSDQRETSEQFQAQQELSKTTAPDENNQLEHGVDYDNDGLQPATEPAGIKTPITAHLGDSLSEQAGIIIPFSTILHKMSPAPCPAAENELFDFSGVIAQTPDRMLSAQELLVPARSEKDNPFLDIDPASGAKALETPSLQHATSAQQMTSAYLQEQAYPHAPAERSLVQPKELVPGRRVAFVTRKSTAELGTFQVRDSQEKDAESNFLESSLNGNNPIRTNRWTYSKRQRETVTQQQNTISSAKASEEQQTRSKKVKTSSTSSSVVTQTRTASELYERRKSPTRLASGSSRVPSNGAVPVQIVARGTRRSQRQKRGDKYNARFSQGG